MSADDPNAPLSESERLEIRMQRERQFKPCVDGSDNAMPYDEEKEPARPFSGRPRLRLVPPSPYSQRKESPENAPSVQR